MEMNVKFDSIAEVLEFAKLFNGGTPNNVVNVCKEVCNKACSEDKEESGPDADDSKPVEKPKAKRKPRKKAEPKTEVEAQPEEKEEIKVEVESVTVNDKEVPTLNGNAIVDEKPEVATEKVEVHDAEAPKLFNTVMSVNETVRENMMSGAITRESLMKIGPKLSELNAALFDKFKDATINDKEATVAEIVRMINEGEALSLVD